MKFNVGSMIGETFMKLEQSNPFSCLVPCIGLTLKVFTDDRLSNFSSIPSKTERGDAARELEERPRSEEVKSIDIKKIKDVIESAKKTLYNSSVKQVGTVQISTGYNIEVRVFDKDEKEPIFTLKNYVETRPRNTPPGEGFNFQKNFELDLYKDKESSPRTKVVYGYLQGKNKSK